MGHLFLPHFADVGCSARGNEGWEPRGSRFVTEASDYDLSAALSGEQALVAAVEWLRRYGTGQQLGTKGWARGCDEQAAALCAADPGGAVRVEAEVAAWQAEERRLRDANDDARRAAWTARSAVTPTRAREARQAGGRWPAEVEAAEAAAYAANDAWTAWREGRAIVCGCCSRPRARQSWSRTRDEGVGLQCACMGLCVTCRHWCWHDTDEACATDRGSKEVL